MTQNDTNGPYPCVITIAPGKDDTGIRSICVIAMKNKN